MVYRTASRIVKSKRTRINPDRSGDVCSSLTKNEKGYSSSRLGQPPVLKCLGACMCLTGESTEVSAVSFGLCVLSSLFGSLRSTFSVCSDSFGQVQAGILFDTSSSFENKLRLQDAVAISQLLCCSTTACFIRDCNSCARTANRDVLPALTLGCSLVIFRMGTNASVHRLLVYPHMSRH